MGDRRDVGGALALLEALRAAGDSEVGSSISISPSARRATTGKPESWNTPSIRRFSDSTVAVNVSIPSSAAAARQVGEQHRRDPVAVPGVGHRERDLRPSGPSRM